MVEITTELKVAIDTAINAGKATLKYYGKEIKVDVKYDNSPLTAADLESNQIIEEGLKATGIPVLSEESKSTDIQNRKNWKKFWLVDPLDGTKEFINNSDEYTVNIALIIDKHPEMGIIYVPAKDILYFGQKNLGAYKVENAGQILDNDFFSSENLLKLPVFSNETPAIVASRSHLDDNTKQFIEKSQKIYKNVKVENYGSSLKLCMIAEGRADIYPRMGPTMEWDIAAGHAIVEAAGFRISKYPALTPLEYNKESLVNSWFIAFNTKYKPVEID